MNTLRRLLDGSAICRSPDDEGAAAPPAAAAEPAPGEGAQPGEAGAGEPPEPEGVEGGEPEGGESGGQPPKEPSLAERRIDRLTSEKWAERRRAAEAERRNAELERQVAEMNARLNPPPADIDPNDPNAPRYTQRDLEEVSKQLAENHAQELHFRSEIDTAATEAREQFKDFDSSVTNLTKFGPLPRTFLEGVLEAQRSGGPGGPKAGEIIYHLGKDLNEADRILSLPPIRQAVALAQFALNLKNAPKPKTVSDAPPPIGERPSAQSRRSYTLDDPNMPIADWMELRNKQLAARGGR